MSVIPFIDEPSCRLDISRLGALVPTAEQNHHGIAPLGKIDAVAGAIMDAQFTDPLSDGRCVARLPIGETVQAGRDQRPCSLVLELRAPFAKYPRLLQFENAPM